MRSIFHSLRYRKVKLDVKHQSHRHPFLGFLTLVMVHNGRFFVVTLTVLPKHESHKKKSNLPKSYVQVYQVPGSAYALETRSRF
jgi:hypothetical protein